MESPQKQLLTDTEGKPVGVFLPIKEYNDLIEKLEELEDIRAYDEAKKEDDGTRISLSDYRAKRGLVNG